MLIANCKLPSNLFLFHLSGKFCCLTWLPACLQLIRTFPYLPSIILTFRKNCHVRCTNGVKISSRGLAHCGEKLANLPKTNLQNVKISRTQQSQQVTFICFFSLAETPSGKIILSGTLPHPAQPRYLPLANAAMRFSLDVR